MLHNQNTRRFLQLSGVDSNGIDEFLVVGIPSVYLGVEEGPEVFKYVFSQCVFIIPIHGVEGTSLARLSIEEDDVHVVVSCLEFPQNLMAVVVVHLGVAEGTGNQCNGNQESKFHF